MVEITIVQKSYRYEENPVHRNGANGKSQWTISQAAELQTFSQSIEKEWHEIPLAWGLYITEGSPNYLGIDRDHETQLFIARFEAKSAQQVWHGYPINYRSECPPTSILNKWIKARTLSRAKIAKINCGKKCNL